MKYILIWFGFAFLSLFFYPSFVSNVLPKFVHSSPPEYIPIESLGFPSTGNGFTVRVNVEDSMSVSVTHNYFGLYDLPVYMNGIEIRWIHDLYFYGLIAVSVLLVALKVFILFSTYGNHERQANQGEMRTLRTCVLDAERTRHSNM